MMDAKQLRNRSPFQPDSTMYNNWPSPKAVQENKKTFKLQHRSIERLSSSPSRTSPMAKLNKTLTIDFDRKKSFGTRASSIMEINEGKLNVKDSLVRRKLSIPVKDVYLKTS